MSRRFDLGVPTERAQGLTMANAVIKRGGLVLLPTDTVYAIAADAFDADAVAALLAAKGRDRRTPVPVMVPSPTTLHGIFEYVTDDIEVLVEAFWPGALTIVARAAPSLRWDLGDTDGTVSARMPLHPALLDLLKETGPLAVMAANRSGLPAPTTADEAAQALFAADQVEVLLDGGTSPMGLGSSIVDLSGAVPLLVREGAIDAATILEFLPDLEVLA
jgi:L-threonylcarbamoyladenylate synthase